MDRSLIKYLCGMQVGPLKEDSKFMVFGEQEIWALVDTWCVRTLVQKARYPWAPEMLQMSAYMRMLRSTKQR